MSAEEKWQAFGATMGDVIEYIVIYFIVLGGVFLVTIIVALLYAVRKSKQRANGIDPKTNKANIGWRIALTILTIMLLVLLLLLVPTHFVIPK